MLLWTIQPKEVLDIVQEKGVYVCDKNHEEFFGKDAYDNVSVHEAYNWMVKQMKERIGNPPEGVEYPIWAWHTWDWKRQKPDLRRSIFKSTDGSVLVCLELEIPDNEVLLSDEDLWYGVLNNRLITRAKNAKDYDEAWKEYEELPEDVRELKKLRSWENIFDVTHKVRNAFTHIGEYIQATFWELKKEYIKEVRYIHSKAKKKD